MNVCKCENLSLWGAFDIIHSTAPFPIDENYVKVVQFDFEPKLRTKRFLVFCGNLLPVGDDDGANRDVIVKCRRDRPASDEYWTHFFNRMDIGRNILAKFDDLTDGKRGDREIDFSDVFEAKFDGYSYWDEVVLAMKDFYHRRLVEGEHVIIEEYLPGKFENFDDSPDEFIQSFQHFSYDYSEREFILFGLEGVKFDDFYKVSVPFIHSVKKEFGPRDKGEDGILDFFANHVCSDICRKWTTPKKLRRRTKVFVDEGDLNESVCYDVDDESVKLGFAGVRFSKLPNDKSEDDDAESCKSEEVKVSQNDEYINLNLKREKSRISEALHADDSVTKSDEEVSKPSVAEVHKVIDTKLKQNGFRAIHPDQDLHVPDAKSKTDLPRKNKPTQNGSCVRDKSTNEKDVFHIQGVDLDLSSATLSDVDHTDCKNDGETRTKAFYLNNNDPKQEELNTSLRKLATNELVIHCNYLGEKYHGKNGLIKSTRI